MNALLLSGADEGFTHQVPMPHAYVGSSDPGWRERYWISFQDRLAGDSIVSCGIGHYPNQDVLEAFVVHSDGTRQTNLRLSRALSAERGELRVGPFSVEVVEPLRLLRLRLQPNDSGLEFEVDWHADLAPLLEDRHFETSGSRVTHDLIRYVQLGQCSGRLTTAAGTTELTADRWWGQRDHSWGMRPLPRNPAAPPGGRANWAFLLFCPLQLPDLAVHLYLYEAADGRPLHLSARVVRRSGETPAVARVEHDLTWVEGAPATTLAGGRLLITLADGTALDLTVTPRPARAYLRGGGYEGWDGWFQGHWKGADSSAGETWDLTAADQVYRYAKASTDHLLDVVDATGARGSGIAEYIVLPGHRRYGAAAARRAASDAR